mgnify:CR=1 FL=1
MFLLETLNPSAERRQSKRVEPPRVRTLFRRVRTLGAKNKNPRRKARKFTYWGHEGFNFLLNGARKKSKLAADFFVNDSSLKVIMFGAFLVDRVVPPTIEKKFNFWSKIRTLGPHAQPIGKGQGLGIETIDLETRWRKFTSRKWVLRLLAKNLRPDFRIT